MTPVFNNLRLKIYDHERPPSAPPVAFNLLSHEMWHSAATQDKDAPGSRGDVRQFRLDNWRGAPEDAVLRESDGKVPALVPGWRTNALDNDPADIQTLRSTEEHDLWTRAKADLTTQIATLSNKPELTNDERKRLAELQTELRDLDTNGFLEAIPGAQLWGSDASGLYRRLSSANVPFHYIFKRYPSGLSGGKITYTSTLERRPFTLWFYRAKPRPKQVNHFLQVEIGRRLRLVFEGEDRAILYRKNESRPPAAWAAADQERNELLALRFLSPAQSDEIELERVAIARIQQDAKDAGRTVTDADKAAIKSHQDTIKKIQSQVGLTDAEKSRLKQLDAYLFRQIETLELAETAQSLIGTPFSVTFLDSGMGYAQIVLDIGTNTYTFEDRWTTARRLENWLWGNPSNQRDKAWRSDERIEVKGSGGAFGMRFGYVAVNKTDEIRSGPIWFGTHVDPDEGVPVTGHWMVPEGTAVNFRLDPVEDRPGFFQTAIAFSSDGKRLPVVFRAVVQQPAEASPVPSLVLDSITVPGLVLGGTLHLDDERRSALWQLTITAAGVEGGINGLGLPTNLRRRIVDVLVWDGTTWRPAVTGGVIADDTLVHATSVQAPGSEGLGAEAFAFGEVRITVRDRSQLVAESLFSEDLELDGLWLGDAIYHIRRNMGATEAQLAMLPRGSQSGWQLPSAPPGGQACLKPARRVDRLGYITGALVGRFGLGREYYIDEQGRDRLELPANRARTEGGYPIVYWPAEVVANNPEMNQRRFYHAGAEGFQRSRSMEKFCSTVEVYGAVNPDTKQRLSFRYELPEASDHDAQDNPRYVGSPVPGDPVTEDAYNEQKHVEAVGRTLIARNCRIPDTWQVAVPYSWDVWPGEVFLFADLSGNTSAWRVRSAVANDVLTNDELVLQLESV